MAYVDTTLAIVGTPVHVRGVAELARFLKLLYLPPTEAGLASTLGATPMTVPTDLCYTTDHEWVRTEGSVATVGITAYASSSLGDVVFVGLPTVGQIVTAGQICGEIESTKSVSDLNSPVAGEVVEVNQTLSGEPGLTNSDPYGAGWLFRVRVQGPVSDLLDAAVYTTLTEEG